MGTTSQDAATLLDILIDGFEKNESLRGFTGGDAGRGRRGSNVDALTEEVRRWKGRRCGWSKTRCGGLRRGPIWRSARRGVA
jgi:hypothetical protein